MAGLSKIAGGSYLNCLKTLEELHSYSWLNLDNWHKGLLKVTERVTLSVCLIKKFHFFLAKFVGVDVLVFVSYAWK